MMTSKGTQVSKMNRHGRVCAGQYKAQQNITGSNLLVSFSSTLKSLLILSPISPSGILTSSLVSPSSFMRERKPSSEMSS